MTIVGILLVIVSIVGINIGWRANEWREPMFMLMGILNPKLADFYSQSKKREVILMMFELFLYLFGAILIYIKNPFVWLLVIELLLFLWLIKGVIGLIRAGHSKKIRLLNYLYSPYLLAWRRDHLLDYSDEQLAAAICEASGVDINQLSISDMTLDNFLIELCVHTRPNYESEQYSDIFKKLHEEADGMVWDG